MVQPVVFTIELNQCKNHKFMFCNALRVGIKFRFIIIEIANNILV